MGRGVFSALLFTAALLAGLAALGFGPDYILFDVLIPLVPGEKVQGMGVYAAQALCRVIELRKALPVLRDGVLSCGKKDEETLRVIFAVNKGGSVFGARLGYEVAWACGWCPGMAHNEETIWPPQPDYLPSYKSDLYIAIPMAKDWETYAFKNASRKVKCAVLVREPFKVSDAWAIFEAPGS